MYRIHQIIVLIAVCSAAAQVRAQTLCDGTIAGGTVADIDVPGTSCTLQGVTVTGSVSVSNGGTLVTQGSTSILGSLEATESGTIRLVGQTTVSGSVRFTSTSSRIIVGGNAAITSLSLEDAGSAVVRGSTEGISAKNSGLVRVTGGDVGGGGLLIEQGVGDAVLCGANIAGSVQMTETTGDLRAQSSANCAASVISGSLGVEKGTGDVLLRGVTFASGDLGVVDQTGSVEIASAVLSDIKISGLSDSITLDQVTGDSDATINENGGDVTMTSCSFIGDVGIARNQAVTIADCTFGLENVELKLNAGPVVITGNTELSLSVEENDDVEVRDNDVFVGSFTKNTGGVDINDNSFNELSCVDNNPSPTGSNNNVVLPVTDQCQAVVV